MSSFTTPVLKDTGKRWYVEYYYLTPTTLLKPGEKERFERCRDYGGHNRIKDVDKKRQAYNTFYNQLHEQLKAGWSPFEADLINSKADILKPITKWLDEVVAAKKAFQTKNSHDSFRKHIDAFKGFLVKNRLDNYRPEQVEKKHITAYLLSILTAGNKNRTRNNHFIDIKAAFSYLKGELEVIEKNPCAGIPFLPARSETHVSYTETEAKSISDWFNAHNPYMADFCRFIVYAFFRIEEVSSLKIGDIDLDKYQISVPAEFIKQGIPQKKPILSIFKEFIDKMELWKYPKDWYIFSYNEQPGPSRPAYSYFRRRFREMKVELTFDRYHTMYGLRHTFVCMLVESGIPWIDIMRLTGHETMTAFEKYARDIRAQIARDVSEGYTIKF